MKAGSLLNRFQKLTWIAGVSSFLLVVGVAGSAAAVRQESANGTVLLRGVEVGGVNLEGLDFETARQRLKARFDDPLDRKVSVTLDGRPLSSTTRRELGAVTNVEDVYRKMLSIHSGMSPLKRLWYRITGMTVGASLQVKTSVEEGSSRAIIDRIAKSVYRAPRDASFTLVGGSIKVRPEEAGFALDEKKASAAITEALEKKDTPINLVGKVIAPAVTKDTLKDILLVKVGENKLYHYRNEQLLKVYDVATGLPKFPTPLGTFRITEKRFRPTWVNPAKGKGQWGEKLPDKIAPGPGNPLGTRAMNLSAKGIRIHGTSTVASLGFNASHGCIRMRMSDVEELFEQVKVGTPVMIVQAGPLRIFQPTGAPTLEQLVESDGNGAAAPVAAPVVPEAAAPSPSAEPAPQSQPQDEPGAEDQEGEADPPGLGLNMDMLPG
jgi:lipoprotein-anchoring transpeptidase ErfK/SrfK